MKTVEDRLKYLNKREFDGIVDPWIKESKEIYQELLEISNLELDAEKQKTMKGALANSIFKKDRIFYNSAETGMLIQNGLIANQLMMQLDKQNRDIPLDTLVRVSYRLNDGLLKAIAENKLNYQESQELAGWFAKKIIQNGNLVSNLFQKEFKISNQNIKEVNSQIGKKLAEKIATLKKDGSLIKPSKSQKIKNMVSTAVHKLAGAHVSEAENVQATKKSVLTSFKKMVGKAQQTLSKLVR